MSLPHTLRRATPLPHWSVRHDKTRNNELWVTSWAPTTEALSESYSVKYQAHFRKFKHFKASKYYYDDLGTVFYFEDPEGVVYKGLRSKQYRADKYGTVDPRIPIGKSSSVSFLKKQDEI